MDKARQITNNFIEQLTQGYLKPLLEKIKLDSDLDLQIRNKYINIYFKGHNLLKLSEDGNSFKCEIHKVFLSGKAADTPRKITSKDACYSFVSENLPFIKENIIRYRAKKRNLETEFEQLLIRTNNYTEKVNSDYFILDRQYAEAGNENKKDRMDLLGVFIDRESRGKKEIIVTPFMAEVKYSLNPDISDLDKQIDRYYKIAKENNNFIKQLENLLHVKAELGLFKANEKLIDKFKRASIDNDINKMHIIIVLVDYNPYSKLFKDVVNKTNKLSFSKQIYIFNTGFAMWHKVLEENSKRIKHIN